jgi:rod shape-determining protein MreD
VKVALRLALVLASAAVLQRGLFSEVRFWGVAIDAFLLLAVVAGTVVGPDRGAIVGFFSGLALDLLVQTPLGLSALTFCLLGYVGGRLEGSTVRSSPVLRGVLVAGLSAAGVVAYAVVAAVLGQPELLSGRLVVVAAVVAVANVVLAPLARRVLGWAWPDESRLGPALRRVL